MEVDDRALEEKGPFLAFIRGEIRPAENDDEPRVALLGQAGDLVGELEIPAVGGKAQHQGGLFLDGRAQLIGELEQLEVEIAAEMSLVVADDEARAQREGRRADALRGVREIGDVDVFLHENRDKTARRKAIVVDPP